jgi:uncharacterized membrane protein
VITAVSGKAEPVERKARKLRPLWQRLLRRPEGKILLAGVGVLLAYGTVVGLTRIWSQHMFYSLWTMTLTHVLGGRAAGMSWGYSHDLSAWVVITANMGIETFMTMLFYPLFVFSCRRLLVIGPLEAAMSRARAAAEAHHKTVVRFGVPGIFVFVWIPLPMTGPLVGSVIGFLIGLRPWVNVATVLAGTYMAVLCWGIVLHRLVGWLEDVGSFLPYLLVAVLLLVGLGLHVRSLLVKERGKPARDGEVPPTQ